MPRRQDRHLCHAPGCSKSVTPDKLCCPPHWFSLPKALRDAIWREYRPGQERDKQPSARYMAVQRLCLCRLAFRPHDEAAARKSAYYLAQAVAYQEQARCLGLGDPLQGLVPESEAACAGAVTG